MGRHANTIIEVTAGLVTERVHWVPLPERTHTRTVLSRPGPVAPGVLSASAGPSRAAAADRPVRPSFGKQLPPPQPGDRRPDGCHGVNR
jgi:hypothetical protein